MNGTATVWNGTTATSLGTLRGFAYAINNACQVAEASSVDDGAALFATLWKALTYNSLFPWRLLTLSVYVVH